MCALCCVSYNLNAHFTASHFDETDYFLSFTDGIRSDLVRQDAKSNSNNKSRYSGQSRFAEFQIILTT